MNEFDIYRILNDSTEDLHDISYPYIERYHFYTTLTILKTSDCM